MQKRQQLLDAVHRRQPARLPYTYTAELEADELFKKYLGLLPSQSVSEYFNCNSMTALWSLMHASPEYRPDVPPVEMPPGTTRNVWGVEHTLVDTGNVKYYELSKTPLAGAETVSDIEEFPWPDPDHFILPELPDGFTAVSRGDHFVYEMGYIGPFGIAWAMLGMEKLMMDMYCNPAIIEATVAHIERYTLGCLQKIMQKYPGLIDAVGCGDDYGTQESLLVGTELVAKFFMPSLKRHYDCARRHGVMGYHHSCGAIVDMIPLLIEAGVEILNPIQTSAKGMIPATLKKEFGKDLCFHGAVDISTTLRTGTAEQVRREVSSVINALGPDGFILSPSHVMQPDIPPENVVAMYETAQEQGAWNL